jgi:hypothetical protein
MPIPPHNWPMSGSAWRENSWNRNLLIGKAQALPLLKIQMHRASR